VDAQAPPTPTTILDATGHIAVDLPCTKCRYNLRTLPVDGKCPECGHPVTETTAGYLPILDREGRVADDLPCVNCGYNLRTLVATGICPECAARVALSTRGHYLHLAPPRWVKRLAQGALLLIMVPVGAFTSVLLTAWIYFVVSGPARDGRVLLLSIIIGTVCLWLTVRGLLQLTAPEPGTKFRGEGFSARKLARWCLLTLPLFLVGSLALTGLQLAPLGFTLSPVVSLFAVVTLVAFMILPLALLRHVMALMRRIPRPGLVTFAKIEFWGGLVGGIVYLTSHVLMMFVSFSAIAPLAGGAGMPMTPYAGGPNTPGTAATASAPTLTSLGYTPTTVTRVGPGGVTTTMPASMPMVMTPPTFGPMFFLATTLAMVSGCGTLIVGIAGLVLLILVWRALANAARLAEQNALPNTA